MVFMKIPKKKPYLNKKTKQIRLCLASNYIIRSVLYYKNVQFTNKLIFFFATMTKSICLSNLNKNNY